MNAVEVLRDIQSIEVIISDKPQRFSEAASENDYFRQGDVMVWFKEKVPLGFSKSKAVTQLAPGNTKGSRHCLDCLDGVTIMTKKDGDALQGPLLVITQERTITHPEHGDIICPPGVYEITYQRAYAEVLRRVAD
jgi:hypothetical protein